MTEFCGVIEYRLCGRHPAATEKPTRIGFPGEVVSVEKLLVDIIKQNQINLSNFKLEVRQYVDNPSPENGSTGSDGILPSIQSNETVLLALNDLLHTYDRLIINISRRQLGDVNPVVQPKGRESNSRLLGIALPAGESSGDRLLSVASGIAAAGDSMMLADVDRSGSRRTGGISLEVLRSVVASMPETNGQGDQGERSQLGGGGLSSATPEETGILNEKSTEADDVQQLERLAAVANIRKLPIYAGNPPRGGSQHQRRISVPKQVSVATYGYPVIMVEEIACILCNLAVAKPLKLQCCGYTACAFCVDYARGMVDEGQCPVCGNSIQSGDTTQPRGTTASRWGAAAQANAQRSGLPRSANHSVSSSILKEENLDGDEHEAHSTESVLAGPGSIQSKVPSSSATRGGQRSLEASGTLLPASNSINELRGGQTKASDATVITPKLSQRETAALFSRALDMLSKSALAEVVGGTDEVIVRLQHDATPTPATVRQEWAAAKRRMKRSREETKTLA